MIFFNNHCYCSQMATPLNRRARTAGRFVPGCWTLKFRTKVLPPGIEPSPRKELSKEKGKCVKFVSISVFSLTLSHSVRQHSWNRGSQNICPISCYCLYEQIGQGIRDTPRGLPGLLKRTHDSPPPPTSALEDRIPQISKLKNVNIH